MNSLPKNFAPGGTKSFVPSAINLKFVKLTNHKGQLFELRPIVSKFSITESIHSTSVLVNISFADSNNVIEDLQLIGQERIEIVLSRRALDTDEDEEIKLDLKVSEFPRYKRGNNENVQTFEISAVSAFAVFDKTLKISRSYNNTTSAEIKKIYETDLSVSDIEEFSVSTSRSRGILRWQHPLNAVEFFRKNAFNDIGSPFYVFQRLTGTTVIAAQSDLVAEEPYGKYYDGKEFTSKPLSQDDFIERSTRIISVNSQLKLGKTFNSKSGAYASENNYLDYGNKTYTKLDYSFDSFPLSNTLNKKTPLSKSADIDYSQTFQAHCEYISTNEFAFEGETKNHNNLRKENGHIVNAFTENLEFTMHDVQLFGDSFLNAGKVVELKFPKIMDPQVRSEKLYDADPNDIYDQNLSGKYLIVSAAHTLEDGEYFTNIRVKKDSLSFDL